MYGFFTDSNAYANTCRYREIALFAVRMGDPKIDHPTRAFKRFQLLVLVLQGRGMR
jgi:hypothetical protein